MIDKNQLMRITTLSSFLILFPFFLFSQNSNFSEKDVRFFEENEFQFDNWLNYTGLGDFLRINSIEVDYKNQTLDLFLESNYHALDSTISAWKKIKSQFDSTHNDFLETRIIKKFCFLMEIPLEKAHVEIHHQIKNNPNQGPSCFYRIITFEKDKVQVEKGGCQTKYADIEIYDFNLKKDLRTTKIENLSLEKSMFYNVKNSIDTFFYEYFQESRNANFEILKDGKKYRIRNIEREVLKDVEDSFLQKTFKSFGWKAGRFENLDIEIKYKFQEMIFIELAIDGKYGSKTFEPHNSNGIDMEVQHGQKLQEYIDSLGMKIKQHLVNK